MYARTYYTTFSACFRVWDSGWGREIMADWPFHFKGPWFSLLRIINKLVTFAVGSVKETLQPIFDLQKPWILHNPCSKNPVFVWSLLADSLFGAAIQCQQATWHPSGRSSAVVITNCLHLWPIKEASSRGGYSATFTQCYVCVIKAVPV